MAPEIYTPIVVGVGDYVNRSLDPADAHEPLTLILNAIEEALRDTDLPGEDQDKLQAAIDSIDVVRTWTWPYDDLPALIGQKLGVDAKHRFYSDHGGNKPGKLFDEAARRISKGQTKVAVVTGGEALASLSAYIAKKKQPPPHWTKTKDQITAVFSASNQDLGKGSTPAPKPPSTWRASYDPADIGAIHSIGAPIHVYPLFENGFRAHRGQTISQNNDESASLYADFAKVAEQQEYSWNYGKAASKQEIGTVTKRNRMICYPYPLLMNAFNTVNLAGACILTSAEFATELGIDTEKWIYALGGAGTQDSSNFWERPDFYSSPSISRSIDASLAVSGLTKGDIDLHDFYSCFPIVPKVAATHLGLPTDGSKPLTLLGGLTSFGGAGNNYSMHAITETTRQLRKGKGRHGLILANGGVMTYQHAIILSTMRRKDGLPYPDHAPLPEHVTDVSAPAIQDKVEKEEDATIETYTVEFNRDNTAKLAFVVGRLKSNGKRFVANNGDATTLKVLGNNEGGEKIGLVGRVKNDGKRNLFTLKGDDRSSKL